MSTRYDPVEVSSEGKLAIETLRALVEEAAVFLDKYTMFGRHRVIALTHFEEGVRAGTRALAEHFPAPEKNDDA